jgi:hypothetical protein
MTFKKATEYFFLGMASLLIFSAILGGNPWIFPRGLMAALHNDEQTESSFPWLHPQTPGMNFSPLARTAENHQPRPRSGGHRSHFKNHFKSYSNHSQNQF